MTFVHVAAERSLKNVTERDLRVKAERMETLMKVKVEKRPIVVPGFRFAGVACGLKPSGKKDLALLVSDVPATAVAAFTTNQVKAAPVLVGQERIRSGKIQAVVVNSGNANASTAQPGLRLARDMCTLVGQTLGTSEKLVHSLEL
jgi:glutamate N-acetyltransferase/amino-acid N-acetyltransferase